MLNGSWIFLVCLLVGAAALACWAVMRLRASGWVRRPAEPEHQAVELLEQERARRAA